METGDTLEEWLRLAPEWALDTERERQTKRATSSIAELDRFYNTVKPQVRSIAAYLDGFPPDTTDDKAQKLFRLVQMWMESALAVEFYRQPELPESFPRQDFISEHVAVN